jgi:phosphatidylserine/phosphatidylglycerophosphate/cardiolipin synthase-like enzyme
MRKRAQNTGVSVHAIAGSHVVLLGLDVDDTARVGLLGFAIRRTDHNEQKEHWCQGYRIFEANEDHLGHGKQVSTWDNPVQSFLWNDYTAKPTHDYTFRVVPVYGTPEALERDRIPPVDVRVQTEDESTGTHAVYFNRGVAGSQAYLRRFGNHSPDEIGPAAFAWLSRGLVEALLDFLEQAEDSSWGLRAAVYEFNYASVLEGFRAALDRGVDLQIVFDAREKYDSSGTPAGPFAANREAVRSAGLEQVCSERTENKSYIAHNKFVVLLKDDQPVQVWTGSTNMTEGGIFGHSNVGHIVRDPEVAKAYFNYWEKLQTDPKGMELRNWIEENNPASPSELDGHGTFPVFSPRRVDDVLDWYAGTMGGAKNLACLTLAFTLSQPFREALEPQCAALNYLLFDSEADNFSEDGRQDRRIAIGAKIEQNQLDNWYAGLWKRERLTGLNVHVKYLHTKYLLVDPFGDDPLLISGSANFSAASTRNNDENMLVIRGDRRVVDIYLTEFFRIFTHYRARDFGDEPTESTNFLAEDDSWTKEYFDANSTKARQRKIFA